MLGESFRFSDCMKTSVLIRGLGTIGTSLASALSKVCNYEVFGASRNPVALEFAYKKGFVKNESSYTGSCEIEIIFAPKQAVLDILSNAGTAGSIVVDICGTKKEIVLKVLKQSIQDKYVSIHPMVHIEPKGYLFYKENAFKGTTVFMINELSHKAEVNNEVIELLKNIGTEEIISCSALEHDMVLKYRF